MTTEDGFERQFATNCSWAVCSDGAAASIDQGEAEFARGDALEWREIIRVRFASTTCRANRFIRPMFQAYAQSKLADLIFSQELQRRLTAVESPILSTSAHPGYAVTNLQTGDFGHRNQPDDEGDEAVLLTGCGTLERCLRSLPRLHRRPLRVASTARGGQGEVGRMGWASWRISQGRAAGEGKVLDLVTSEAALAGV